MEPLLLAKAFKYLGFEGAKGAIIHGAVYVDQEGIYLFHEKHTWESANTATAAFGLIGALIHHLCTKNKTVDYPFDTTEVGSLPRELFDRFNLRKMKDSALLSIVPRADVSELKKTLTGGATINVGSIQIVPIAPKGKVWKQLPEMGYGSNDRF